LRVSSNQCVTGGTLIAKRRTPTNQVFKGKKKRGARKGGGGSPAGEWRPEPDEGGNRCRDKCSQKGRKRGNEEEGGTVIEETVLWGGGE